MKSKNIFVFKNNKRGLSFLNLKAQISIEFLMIVVAATAIIISLMGLFSHLYQNNYVDRERIIIQDFAYSVQNEFIMAAKSKSGYVRNFELPNKIEGINYDVSIMNSSLLFINSTNQYVSSRIPTTSGQIIFGQNVIKNINNSICINC